MKAVDVSAADLNNLAIIERAASSFSLVGITLIIITYLISPSFHKPINRLVFYACLGNIFTNIATVISRDAIYDSYQICQFQAVLIQMFLPADSFWTLAMACNVYLAFYRSYTGAQLRRLEGLYFFLCYGIPMIPAIVFRVVSTPSKGPMYGNATLWCWISNEWDVFRIAAFYGPVWVVIMVTLGIYIRAGKLIYEKRKQLQAFRVRRTEPMPELSDPFQRVAGFEIQRTTDISVNYEDVDPIDSGDSSLASPRQIQYPAPAVQPTKTFSVKITSSQRNGSIQSSFAEKKNSSSESSSPISPRAGFDTLPARKQSTVDNSMVMWSYTKVALLFFVALMITWIPSSANRLYSVVNPGYICLPLEYASALVLPLQGSWNAIIYFVTCWKECGELYNNIRQGKPLSTSGIKAIFNFRDMDDREHFAASPRAQRTPRHENFFLEEEEGSMTELHSNINARRDTRDAYSSRPDTKDSNHSITNDFSTVERTNTKESAS
ncbi:hypothetical protein G7Y89_g4584 [Cudoniella acicularis]|uniref:G-protein coupled receptors family 2 profile 2 domain-containing protein n=1 Tax=Cudoniella acicularis TaxID=354080 RepID=A0A8H4RRB6_9HELO|nr:hypothetical protein G7Y89_g4584 [Cudoniella acicularis]